MTFALVQSNTNATFSGTTLTISPINPFTAGNAVLIGYALQGNGLTVLSISDGTNTYSIGTQNTGTALNSRAGFAYALNIAAGSPTITLTVTGGTTTDSQIWIEEWSGIATASAFDGGAALGSGGSGSSGQTFNSGALTTTVNGDLIWAWGWSPDNGGAIGVGSGFAIAQSDPADSYLSEFQTQTTAGAITPSMVTTAVNGFDLYLVAAAFKAAGGGAPVVKGATLSMMGVG